MSIKRVIELEKVNVNGEKMYKAVGCNTLFFDENKFNKITEPYNNPTDSNLNCRFVVIDKIINPKSIDTTDLTIGNIYEVKDGQFRNNEEDYLYPLGNKLHSFEELERYLDCSGDYSDITVKIIRLNN